MKTIFPKKQVKNNKIFLINCKNMILGRLLTRSIHLWRGKNCTFFFPSNSNSNSLFLLSMQSIAYWKKKIHTKYLVNSTQKPGHFQMHFLANCWKRNTNHWFEQAFQSMLPKKLRHNNVNKFFNVLNDSTLYYKKLPK